MAQGLKRVVITGVGTISALGNNKIEFWNNLSSGKSAIQPFNYIKDKGAKNINGAFIQNYDPAKYFSHQQLGIYWKNSQLSIIAAREAVKDSGIDFSKVDEFSTCIIMGSASTDGIEEEDLYYKFYGEGNKRINPMTLVHFMRGGIIHQIASENNIHGPGMILDTACASALQSVGEAFKMIQYGRSSVAIAGGGESPFGITHWKAWEQIGAMSADTCRPFCKERSGTILGEGAAAFVLEELDSALARSANIYGEIVGFASTRDAADVTRPTLRYIVKAIELALADAKINIDEIDYINAHGSGTKLNDVVETQAIKEVFGAHAKSISISATKSMHGHLEFATGALELAGGVLAMKNSIVPPTANFLTVDPDCDLDYTPNVAKKREIRAFVKNSFGFGGANSSLVVKKFK